MDGFYYVCACVQEAHGCEELEHLIDGGQRASAHSRGHSNALIDDVKEGGGAGRDGCSPALVEHEERAGNVMQRRGKTLIGAASPSP